MTSKKRKPADAFGVPLCAYCGVNAGVTNDHVVPRCIFPTPPPPNLVTVPACRPCNHRKKSKDDTLLRDFLCCDHAGHDHPVAQGLFNGKVRRSIARNQSEIAKYVPRTPIFRVPMRTPAGLYVGELEVIEFPPGRISSIIFNIVRGLYYDSRRVIFPASTPYDVLRHPLYEWGNLVPAFHDGAAKVLGHLFACKYIYATEDQFTTLWLIGFWERYVFSVRTGENMPPFKERVITSP